MCVEGASNFGSNWIEYVRCTVRAHLIISHSFFRDFFLCCCDIFPCQGASPFAIIEKKANTHRSKWQMQLIEENQLGLTGSIQTEYKSRTELKKFYTKNCIEWGKLYKVFAQWSRQLTFLFFRNAVCRQRRHLIRRVCSSTRLGRY